MTQMIHEVVGTLGSLDGSGCCVAFTQRHEDYLLVTFHKRMLFSLFELVGVSYSNWKGDVESAGEELGMVIH